MDTFLLTNDYPTGYERLVMSKRKISRIKQWATSASAEEIIVVLKSCEVNILWRVLVAVGEQDPAKYNVVCDRIGFDWEDVSHSDEYYTSRNHENMLPDTARYSPISEPPAPGTVINGSWLVVNNEHPAFPTCLVNGSLTSGFNAKIDAPHWVPDMWQAADADHYPWDMRRAEKKRQRKQDAAFRKRLEASMGGN